jgi:UDP-N-acetylmuramate dehydrogenase
MLQQTGRQTLLADLTTLRVGGPAARTVDVESEQDLIEAVRAADEADEPLLVLGGGSNVLISDDGFDGVVVRDVRRGIGVADASACAGVSLTIPAGQPWDEVVVRTVAQGWVGVEALSGIPGSTGATPVQNVGAYGQQVADVIASVRVWDRKRRRVRTLAFGDLHFGYRTSRLKRSLADFGPTPRYVVLDVNFQLRFGTLSLPVRYPELARRLDVELGERAPMSDVREAVLELRRGKGMVLDPDDPDTWSAGSFFTNPILDHDGDAALPPDAPRYPAGGGRVKTSAAWLIERAGFHKGYGLPGRVALSTKHTLALTNRGDASAQDVLRLARTVRDGVRSVFGIELVPEPVLVGCTL